MLGQNSVEGVGVTDSAKSIMAFIGPMEKRVYNLLILLFKGPQEALRTS